VSIEVVNLIATLSFLGVVIGAVTHLSLTVIDNATRLESPAPHEVQARRMREATTTWLALPAAAYLLAVITNVGTSLIDLGSEVTPGRFRLGVLVLTVGLFIILVLAEVALRRARNTRTGLTEINNFRGLLSEVREGGKRKSVRQSEAWLEDMEEVYRRLVTEPDPLSQRAHDAAAGVVGQDIDWRRRSIVGLRVRRSSGQAVRFPAGQAGLYRDLRTSWWSRAWGLCLVICIGAWLGVWYLDRSVAWPGPLTFSLSLSVSAIAFALATRGRCAYLARVGMRDAEYRTEIRRTLDQLTEEQRIARQPPPEAPTGLLRRLLGL
jgi:hypothetical protein